MAQLLVFIKFPLAPVSSSGGDTAVLLRPDHIIGMIPDSVLPKRTTLMLTSGKSVCVELTPEEVGKLFSGAAPRVMTT